MTDDIAGTCVRIFRSTVDLDNSPEHSRLTEAEILCSPIEIFGIDSLSTMEFIMAVEDTFEIELDEDAVNRCDTIADVARLVASQSV